MWNYYVGVFKKFAMFSGRASRAEFWYFFLMHIIIIFVLALVGVIVLGEEVANLLVGLYSLVAFIPTLAVEVRRLHDIGKSGLWILISFIPVIGPIVLIVFLATRGDEGPNQFGEDPYGNPGEGQVQGPVMEQPPIQGQ
jgi:uncharacterized membrane protein YhaH (DUF805 family)